MFDGGGDEGLDAFGGDFGCGAGAFFEDFFFCGDKFGFFYAEDAAEGFALDAEGEGELLVCCLEAIYGFVDAIYLGVVLGLGVVLRPELVVVLGFGEGHGVFLSGVAWVVVEFALAFFAVGGGSCFVFLLGGGYEALLDE